MKIRFSLISSLVVFVFIAGICFSAENSPQFSFSPRKVTHSSQVTVTYNPAGTYLDGSGSIEMVIYELSKDRPNAKGVELKRNGKLWEGEFTVNESARALAIKFVAGEDFDNNNWNGYRIPLVDSEGKRVPGSKAALADFMNFWGEHLEVLRNPGTAINVLKLFEADFNSHPEVKIDYLLTYLKILQRSKRKDADKVIKREIAALENKPDKTTKEVETLYYWYRRVKDKEKATAYKDQLLKKDATGNVAQMAFIQSFRKEKDKNKKLKMTAEFKQKFPDSGSIRNFHYFFWSSYINKKDFEGLAKFIENHPEYIETWMFERTAGMLIKDKDYATALGYAEMAVQKTRAELDKPTEEKWSYITEKGWKKQREHALARALKVYGVALQNLNKKSKALMALKEAYALSDSISDDINQKYTELLDENGFTSKAQNEIEACVLKGKANNKMIEQLKKIYSKKNKGEKGFAAYLSGLKEKADKRMLKKLAKVILDKPAPSFDLLDINGKKVSLADFKGKPVIVDFWATWCGPCVASMPALKKAQEVLANDGSVKFLFINTFEDPEEQKKNAKKFVIENKYPFHVLLDSEGEIAAEFGVTGIPTKFIVDKNGKIRFKSIGFHGSEDQLVEDLRLMLKMVE